MGHQSYNEKLINYHFKPASFLCDVTLYACDGRTTSTGTGHRSWIVIERAPWSKIGFFYMAQQIDTMEETRLDVRVG